MTQSRPTTEEIREVEGDAPPPKLKKLVAAIISSVGDLQDGYLRRKVGKIFQLHAPRWLVYSFVDLFWNVA